MARPHHSPKRTARIAIASRCLTCWVLSAKVVGVMISADIKDSMLWPADGTNPQHAFVSSSVKGQRQTSVRSSGTRSRIMSHRPVQGSAAASRAISGLHRWSSRSLIGVISGLADGHFLKSTGTRPHALAIQAIQAAAEARSGQVQGKSRAATAKHFKALQLQLPLGTGRCA